MLSTAIRASNHRCIYRRRPKEAPDNIGIYGRKGQEGARDAKADDFVSVHIRRRKQRLSRQDIYHGCLKNARAGAVVTESNECGLMGI